MTAQSACSCSQRDGGVSANTEPPVLDGGMETDGTLKVSAPGRSSARNSTGVVRGPGSELLSWAREPSWTDEGYLVQKEIPGRVPSDTGLLV